MKAEWRWAPIMPTCGREHPSEITGTVRHVAGCEFRRWHIHPTHDDEALGPNNEAFQCFDCGTLPGAQHWEMWPDADEETAEEPVDPDKEHDFESLARILNRAQEIGGVNALRSAAGLEEAPGGKLYDENEARAIEHIATARGMLLADVLGDSENELDRKVIDLLTAALEELIPHG